MSKDTLLNAFCIIYNSHEKNVNFRAENLINLCVSNLCKFDESFLDFFPSLPRLLDFE